MTAELQLKNAAEYFTYDKKTWKSAQILSKR